MIGLALRNVNESSRLVFVRSQSPHARTTRWLGGHNGHMADWSRTQHPIRAIHAMRPSPLDAGRWPATIPAVSQLLCDGLELGPATVLVGDNGSGKSTIIEALAMAYGINPEGGSAGAQHRTRPSESPLYEALVLQKSAAAYRGYFLRAETMHGLYTYPRAEPAARE